MKKFTLSLLAVSTALALSACSSSSGGSDNSEQLRQTENALRQQLVEVETKANSAEKSASNANSRAAKAEAELKTANENTTKLTAQVAAAVEQEKETAKKVADLELAQAKAELNNSEQQNAQKQAKAESEKRIAELEEKAKKAAQDLDEAKANSQKASEELEKLKLAEQKAQEEKEAAAKRLQDLENLQASEKARIPLSDLVFGGTSGTVPKTFTGISGGVWQIKGENWELNAPNTRDGIGYLAIVDQQTGRIKDIQLSTDVWGNMSGEPSAASSPIKFPDVRFGVYVDDLDGTVAIYSQGLASAIEKIPTSGTAQYKGALTRSKDDSHTHTSRGLIATVDFGNKNIDFTVKEEKFNRIPEMAFSAKITANSFAGDVNNIKTQGAFFGENANQLSGLYINGNDNSRGAYGAVKVE